MQRVRGSNHPARIAPPESGYVAGPEESSAACNSQNRPVIKLAGECGSSRGKSAIGWKRVAGRPSQGNTIGHEDWIRMFILGLHGKVKGRITFLHTAYPRDFSFNSTEPRLWRHWRGDTDLITGTRIIDAESLRVDHTTALVENIPFINSFGPVVPLAADRAPWPPDTRDEPEKHHR